MISPRKSGFILRARVVLPVKGPAIDNGAVFVSGEIIGGVGRHGEVEAASGTPVEDLGDVILMPGLVNAHCHLEYTNMAGNAPAIGGFVEWLRGIIQLKGQWHSDLFRQSWRDGARMLVESGTTTVADIISEASALEDIRDSPPLRTRGFLELTGLLADASAEELVQQALRKVEELSEGGVEAGLSPHSLYSTARGLVAEVSRRSVDKGLRTTMHLAESDEEQEMFVRGKGRMFDWLREMGRDMSDCGGRSPIALAADCGALNRRMLLAHVNRLEPGDARRLGESSASVAHCPRSHAFFGHHRFPYEELRAAAVNVCLGTDSLASVNLDEPGGPCLNMFEEMRRFSQTFPKVDPADVVRMATLNGAEALGMNSRIGELSPGAFADCVSIPYEGCIDEASEALVDFRNAPRDVMVAGNWAERNAA